MDEGVRTYPQKDKLDSLEFEETYGTFWNQFRTHLQEDLIWAGPGDSEHRKTNQQCCTVDSRPVVKQLASRKSKKGRPMGLMSCRMMPHVGCIPFPVTMDDDG